jgi:magnesium-transporting ATPase (P-type)
MENDIQSINTLLNDIWNFQLILFGLAVTLFTVIYSFLIAKRDELRSISDSIKNGDTTAITKQKETFARKYILRLKKINNHISILVVTTFFISFIGWTSERFIFDCEINLKRNLLIILFVLTAITLFVVFYQSLKIFNHYKESTKI